jgi:hypothetical protein
LPVWNYEVLLPGFLCVSAFNVLTAGLHHTTFTGKAIYVHVLRVQEDDKIRLPPVSKKIVSAKYWERIKGSAVSEQTMG